MRSGCWAARAVLQHLCSGQVCGRGRRSALALCATVRCATVRSAVRIALARSAAPRGVAGLRAAREAERVGECGTLAQGNQLATVLAAHAAPRTRRNMPRSNKHVRYHRYDVLRLEFLPPSVGSIRECLMDPPGPPRYPLENTRRTPVD